MANSTRGCKPRNHQAAKPYPEYPLTAHPSGRWCKRARGKIHYFGPLSDPDAALTLWLKQKDKLLAGRIPREEKAEDAFTLRKLANHFLRYKQSLVKNGELSVRTFDDAYRTCR
jgi:hypothetical protein